jgi:hypothetical protein
VTHSLNFDDLVSGDYFVHEAVVADANAISMLGTRKLLAALWKRVIGQSFGRGDDSGQLLPREFAQVFLRRATAV